MIVTTTNDVTGYRVVQHLGVVRGSRCARAA